ncbi:transglycosylase domain-containing protein [Phycicoccus endophyticus]|uniref:Transglycosylase domain-containing protein n=1 Tax=Phycicoccus endophyticus TaxID=1690220 RepID=A0A7G9QZW8_9MICO|nr:transglycosylase domain-containing protein [Phycicoccus endophyticus]NHI20096.1 PASTA domain-containing protein [Phycicoccus endophyticus]QNN48893.1 transglycosylase domain-containing protein [Phycicoccus endophyticus]
MDGRAQNISAVLRLLLGFVVLSAVSGLLVAGIAVPAIGAGGQAAKDGVEAFNELPSEFTISPLAQQSKIVDAKNNVIANPYDENRIIVPLKKISQTMQDAQIAIEDARFYEHGGLDPRGFTRALISNLQGGQVQGASTLTQQYVKITLQEQALRAGDEQAAEAAVEKNYARKLQELKYAINVEDNYTKDQILQGYLNLVYYGDQAYGVEAAALNYFGVHASKLNLGQSALLAGIVQQPTAYNPVINPKQARARRDVVLTRMEQLGLASAKDVAAAKKVPVVKMVKKTPVKGVCHRSSQPYFCAYVMAYLQNSPQLSALGKTPEERLKRINQGGLTIRTTLDPAMQKAAQQEIVKAVPIGNKSNLGGATSVVEPGTGKVLAMAQASNFEKTQTNWNVDQVYGGGPYGYQFGSTAKVFGLVTALEKGMPMDSQIYVPFASSSTPYSFDGPEVVGAPCGADKPWDVTNDYSIGGREMSLAEGISKSINTWAAQLTIDVGPCDVLDTMKKMGVHMANGEEILRSISNATLGSGTTTPLDLASAYATLAASGTYCEPSPIVSITTPEKEEIKVPKTECKQVISADTADAVSYLLKGTLRAGGTAQGLWDVDQRPAAGKTGTTENHNQGWFVGYTPQVATAVWTGNVVAADKNGALYTLNGKCFGDYGCFSKVFGNTVSAPVWAATMKRITEGMPAKDFPAPSEKARRGDLDPIPSVYGRDPDTAIAILQDAGFAGQVGSTINSDAPAGTVAGTSPSSSALAGSTVTLYISAGPAPDPEPTTPEPSKTSKPTSSATPTTPSGRQRPTKPPGRG